MKRYILIVAALAFVGAAFAQKPVNRTGDVFTKGVAASNVTLAPEGSNMNVSMDIDYSAATVAKNESLDIVPVITDGTNVVELPALGLYGSQRYYKYVRENGTPRGDGSLRGRQGGKIYKLLNAKKANPTEHYSASVPYQKWMDKSQLLLRQTCKGCCNNVLGQGVEILAAYAKNDFKFSPDFQYVQPVAEAVKNRAEQGEAYLSYAVGRSTVVKSYKDNAAEIQKIVDLVNTLKDNSSEYSVKGISLTGYASPDGSYAVNERLAKARTESLKAVVAKALADKQIPVATQYVAEDWDGVCKWIEESSVENKDEILEIARGELKPDAKDRKIASAYPVQYRQIKNECYPALRRAAYVVDYEVVPYVDINQIKSKIESNPKDLSLNEFFMAANTCKAGSAEFNYIMEKALAQYPASEVALVNAANSAMSVGNLTRAGELLSKIADNGTSAQAPYFTYAKAVYAALTKDYKKAVQLFGSVKEEIPAAVDALTQLADAE